MRYFKGSEWRKWDLHLHTPFTKLNNNYNVEDGKDIWDVFCKKINDSDVEVFGITDYFSVDNFFIFIEKFKDKYSNSNKRFFPNVEFRLDSKNSNNEHIQVHVVFSNDEKTLNKLNNFLTRLELLSTDDTSLTNKFCVNDDLQDIGYAKAMIKIDNLEIKLKENFNSSEYLIIGVANGYGSLRPGQNDGRGAEYAKELDKKCHMFFGTSNNTNFYLNKVNGRGQFNLSPKPIFSGSDAHSFTDINNKLGKTFNKTDSEIVWIKANPCFDGLRQVLNEPDERVFIGENPQKKQLVSLNKTKYIDKIKINKTSSASASDIWFNNELELNENLVTIIGNKGNGKSALADIISLCGNTRLIDSTQFSFLHKDKFKRGGLAKNFEATLTWKDGTSITKNLAEDISYTDVEKIKYLPQKYIETICTHDYEKFQDEINKVVFSHISESDRLRQDSLKSLIKEKTDFIQKKRYQIRNNLRDLFEKEIAYKIEYSDDEIKRIYGRINEKDNEIKDHDKYRAENIPIVPKPDEDESIHGEQKVKFKKIERLNKHQNVLNEYVKLLQEKINTLATQKNTIINSQHKIESYIEEFEYFKEELDRDFKESNITLNIDELLSLKYKKELLQVLESNTNIILNKNTALIEKVKGISKDKKVLIESLHDELDEVQKKYQSYIEQMSIWTQKQQELLAEKNKLQNKIKFKSEELSNVLKEIKHKIFLEFSKLYETYQDELNIYEELYKPVLEFVDNEKKKRISGLKGFIEFTTDIVLKKSDFKNKILDFFDNRRKKFNDDDIIELLANSSLNSIRDIYRLNRKIVHIISKNKKVEEQFRDSKELIDFYLTLADLDSFSVEYDILLDTKKVSQLSPGERGALLIIFYLLVDKDDIPLIIDQPEDNLDNESVYEYLVPYIQRAKQRRQIIIVTHNPNIAVVADSEQVIYSKIDKSNKNKVAYTSGAIEDSIINQKIIEVLEGTFPAFDNRTKKYYRNSK